MADLCARKRFFSSSATLLVAESAEFVEPTHKRPRQDTGVHFTGKCLGTENIDTVANAQTCASACEPTEHWIGRSCSYSSGRRRMDEQHSLGTMKKIRVGGPKLDRDSDFSPYLNINSMLHRLHDEHLQRRVSSTEH
eukprot:TRINITY_DN60958_c0_g1_i1.p1 TRINITY_DN60958_c0_g1~~TRINITY_DN60958_c0_g1_i1.p1  ORF type:complete len:137 (-),score=8.14 TRINITY_DN60958_c0_g1_i1:192-602(-)